MSILSLITEKLMCNPGENKILKALLPSFILDWEIIQVILMLIYNVK